MQAIELTRHDPAGATTRFLRVRGQPLKIVTDSPGADGLVSETFSPQGMLGVFDSPHEPDPDLTVVDLARDPADIDELLREAAGAAVPGEYELTRHYRLPRYTADTFTVFTLRDVNSDEAAALIRTEGRVTIVRPRSNLGDRWLTRIIRDAATRIAKAEGSLVLHSSAFVHDHGAYLVVGDSGAGKSTTAVALARLLPSSGWMGNDRMHLDRRQDAYHVTACPLPLAINKGSLDVMGVTGFADWSVRAGFPPPDSDWDRFQGEDKLKLSSREVERYLGVEVVPDAPLAGVILPHVDLTAGYSLEAASPAYAAEVIARNCFSLDDNLYGEDWLEVPVRRPGEPPSLDALLEHLAKLPVLRCTLGGAADVARLAEGIREATRA